jgi:hypothetical protein
MEEKHDTLGWEQIRLKIPLMSHVPVEYCTLYVIYVIMYL